MSNVLVMFQADTECTEQMALAVAVGAVEAEANIRLRRLAAPHAVEVVHKGYGQLQERDLLWANTVVVGLESPQPRTEDLNELLSLLGAVDPEGLSQRRAWTFSSAGLFHDRTEAQILVESSLHAAGFAVLPARELRVVASGELIDQMKEAGRMSGRLVHSE